MTVTEQELFTGYAGSGRPTAATRVPRPAPSPVAVAVALETRIAELRGYVRWYADMEPTRRFHWRDLEAQHRGELAALLRIVRRARRVEADRPDPIDAAKAWHDWQAAGPA